MPANRSGVLDLVASIGPLAPLMHMRKDICDLLPCVPEVYQVKIGGELCQMYVRYGKEYVSESEDVKHHADALLEEFGPLIWSREKKRPWLLKAGEHELYKKDLYFDNPEHHEILQRTFRQIVIAKILRFIKDHGHKYTTSQSVRSSSEVSRSSARPLANRSSRRTTIAPVKNDACCHLDGRHLQELGIWLGDYGDDEDSVNGRSFAEIESSYNSHIWLASAVSNLFPDILKKDPERLWEHVQCSQCSDGRSRTITCTGFSGGMLWIFPCRLGYCEVFAIIRPESGDNRTWVFWTTEGGYDTSPTAPRLEYLHEKTRIQGDEPQSVRQGTSASKRIRYPSPQRPSGAKRIRVDCLPEESDSDSDNVSIIPARPWTSVHAPGRARESQRTSSLQLAPSEKAYGKRPVVEPSDKDSLEDVTPGRETHGTILYPYGGFFKKYASQAQKETEDSPAYAVRECARQEQQDGQHGQVKSDETSRRDSRTVASDCAPPAIMVAGNTAFSEPAGRGAQENHAQAKTADSPPAQKLQPPGFTLRFRLWLTVPGSARSVVFLDDTMTVEAVYSRIHGVIDRKLEGAEMACFTVTLPAEEPFDVEAGNEDAWEVLLEMVRAAGLAAVSGTVSRKE